MVDNGIGNQTEYYRAMAENYKHKSEILEKQIVAQGEELAELRRLTEKHNINLVGNVPFQRKESVIEEGKI